MVPWFGQTCTNIHTHTHSLSQDVMLVLFFMLSGAYAYSVAVVKSLYMGNRTGTYTYTLRGVSVVFDPQHSLGHNVCLVTSRFCHSRYSTLCMKGYFPWAGVAWPGAQQGFKQYNHWHTNTHKIMHMYLGDQLHLYKVIPQNTSWTCTSTNTRIQLMPNSIFIQTGTNPWVWSCVFPKCLCLFGSTFEPELQQ